MTEERLGRLPPRYSFALNPHEEMRCTRCPQCGQPTRLRKFALLVGIKDYGMVVLGKTCRFCPICEFIIAHQDELEGLLAASFVTSQPEVIGSDYYVLGTVERKTWRKGLRDATTPKEVLDHTADFKKEFDLHYEPGGWYPTDEEDKSERQA
ncbi:MAG TPA: hypothetical protein VF791_10980 [Pyrinomonadaceae bacterium]